MGQAINSMKIIFLSSYDGGRIIKRSPKIDNDGFYTYGWSANRARALKKHYPEYDIEVWRFSKYTVGYFEKSIENINFKVYPAFRIKYFFDLTLKGFRDLLMLSKREPILICLSHLHKWLVYIVSFFFRNIPIIVEDYGGIPPQVKVMARNPLKKVFYNFNLRIEKSVFKYIDFFFWGDQNQIQYIKEVYPEFKGDILPSFGLNLSVFYPTNKIAAKQQLGWDISKKYILYVGRLEKIKNVDELIKIWIEVKREMPEVELVFVGGTEIDPFYNFAKENNVIVYPRTMNIDLPIYYSAADVYALLTLENAKFSGIGIAPTESLACGTPVVSGGLRNIVGGTLDGIGEAPQTLEEYKEGIIKVLKNPDKYTNCQDVIIQHYTQEATSNRFEKVIKQLISKYSFK
jgi:glycosyltransferase involved in cell wall biosynthesis